MVATNYAGTKCPDDTPDKVHAMPSNFYNIFGEKEIPQPQPVSAFGLSVITKALLINSIVSCT